MGSAVSTQLKLVNQTPNAAVARVSETLPKLWVPPNTPYEYFHNANIAANSEYSRELTINARRRTNTMTLTVTFAETGKRLVFRLDQGATVNSRRNRLPHKEKNIFTITGDVEAFEVKHVISGNTLTIEIKDSYMYKAVRSGSKGMEEIKFAKAVNEVTKKEPKLFNLVRDALEKEVEKDGQEEID